MSFLFGSGRGHVDPEMAAGRKRAEQRFARDIGDEKALVRDAELPRRRMRMWPVMVVLVAMVLGGLGLLPHGSAPFSLRTDCAHPAMVLRQYDAVPGGQVEWKTTGPREGDYVLVLDGGSSITGQGDSVQVGNRGTVASPVFRMGDCTADQSLSAPQQTGAHLLRLFHREQPGSEFTMVASASLTVH